MGTFGKLVSLLVFFSCSCAFAAEAQQNSGVQAPTAPAAPLKVGDDAPDFKLAAVLGDKVSEIQLSQFRGKKKVVLYFYPKDRTPGCTQEARDFQTDYEKFQKAGAEVLGVSVDDVASHKSFASKEKLAFPLLADVGGVVARKYGVMGWIMAKRVTYVVGLNGKIEQTYAEVDVGTHSKTVYQSITK